MANTVTTLATYVTAPVNYVLMRGLLSAARRCLPFFNGTIPGDLMKNGGSMSVKWRRIDNLALATSALSELQTATFRMGRSASTPIVTDITKAVAKYGNHFLPNEEVDLFNVNSRNAQLVQNLGENAGASLNALARNEFKNATNLRLADGVATVTSIITPMDLGEIRYAVNQLNRKSAMKMYAQGTGSQNVTSSTIRASYFGICHHDTEEVIRTLTGFIGVEQYASHTATFPHEFGAVGGVRWAATELCEIDTGAGTTSPTSNIYRGSTAILNDVYETFIYGREAVGTVGLGSGVSDQIMTGGPETANQSAIELISVPPRPSVADPYGEVALLSWKAWFACKVLNENWIWRLKHLVQDTDSL